MDDFGKKNARLLKMYGKREHMKLNDSINTKSLNQIRQRQEQNYQILKKQIVINNILAGNNNRNNRSQS